MARRLPPLAENTNIAIDEAIFNAAYLPYLDKIYNYEVLYGGAGSGKSVFADQKYPMQLTVIPGRNMVCIRHQEKDCRDSVFPAVVLGLTELKLIQFWEVKEHPSPRLINRINGNEIRFTGMDDVENVKSIKFKTGDVTDFLYEEVSEEPSVDTIRTLDDRLRSLKHKNRLILIFNPVSRTHWLYNYITQELKGRDALILKTTYKDNKFLPKEYIEKLERYQYSDPYRYQVYALGEWGTMGQSVFDTKAIHSRLSELQQKHENSPPTRITFTFERDANGLPNKDTFTHFIDSDGETVVYKFPEAGHPYVVSFDPAGEGDDLWAGQVCDNITGEQVATYHSPRQSHECILQLYGLGRLYNDALICPETNFGDYALLKLVELRYPLIFQRQQAADNYSRGMEQKLGFRTTAENRKRIIEQLIAWANANMKLLNDVETLNEMLTFTRQQKKLKGIWMGAEAGAHDDLVMALAIMLEARSQQVCEMVPDKVKLTGFYLKPELELMVKDGRITKGEMRDYLKRNTQAREPRTQGGRGGRYVR